MAAPMSLKSKVALVTGASSGIGAATSILFAKLGAQLSLTGRNEENLNKVGKECEKHGTQVLLTIGDVTIEEDNKNIVDKTVEHYGRIDILISNAGISALGCPVVETSMETYDKIMNLNVRAVFHMTKLVIPHLIKTKGCIVNVSSVRALRGFANKATYCMSKAALDSFTQCTALELAPYGVRVNSINPGIIDTGIQLRAGMSEEDYLKVLEKCKTTYPLGRAGKVEEVTNAIAFLASDASSFTTGVKFPVDGGREILCPR